MRGGREMPAVYCYRFLVARGGLAARFFGSEECGREELLSAAFVDGGYLSAPGAILDHPYIFEDHGKSGINGENPGLLSR